MYPNEYMDTWDRFTEPKLPHKEVFYSKLTDARISEEDYAHAQKVWETFGCKTLGDYSDLYCQTDVLLLADVLETFRRTCHEQYGLDPAHYYTSPGLSWYALLKKTGIELELLTDYDQHLFIEKGMQGGISMASKRHARANNPLVEEFDPGQPSSHILYLDANNLYGWAMSQCLSTSGFWWVDDCQQLAKTIAEQPADSPEGCILEVDLEYPEDLHDQSPWMEPYIRMNTELRKKAASDFEKDLYKLMNNSVFGKTMEDLRRRVDVKLVRSHEDDKLRRLIASPAFARANIFDDDLAAIQIHKSRLALNHPVFVGMSILDLSKHLMYDFYYNQLRGQYEDRCQLLYTDTNSLLLKIQSEDVFRDMASHAELYDTSDYPPEHPLHSITNKKVCAGHPIAEYVDLHPKMYSILEAGGGNIKKAKGVKKNVVKKHIRHEHYKEALFEKQTFRHSMDVLRSERDCI